MKHGNTVSPWCGKLVQVSHYALCTFADTEILNFRPSLCIFISVSKYRKGWFYKLHITLFCVYLVLPVFK